MLKAFKYRLYPTPVQQEQLSRIFGSVRMVYNLGLELKVESFTKTGKAYSVFDLCNQLPDLKEGYPWLSEVPSQALQMSLRNLDNAFTNFFRGAGFPAFKSRKNKQSFQLPQGIKCSFETNKIFIPKLRWTACIFHRPFTGTVKTVTVSRNASGEHYVSVLVENDQPLPPKAVVNRVSSVGVDVGLAHFLTLSDETKVDNPRFLFKKLKQLKREQRSLSRKFQKGKEQSKNYQKQKVRVAKLHNKITNQRTDFLHKVSSAIIKQHDTIFVEDLDIRGMQQNKQLSRSIADVGWGTFITFLTYKAEWSGKNVIKIGRFEPSSKICSVCGSMKKDMNLAVREWTCSSCQTKHDRDVNAACNIKNFGLRNQPLSGKQQ